MEDSQPKRKLTKLNFYNDEPLKLWLIPEIYGWLIVLIGFGIFVMLLVAAIAYLIDVGFSFDAFFSLLQLAEGIAIGGGFIAFGTALRRFVVVQATLCVIFLLITILFLYLYLVYGTWEEVGQTLLISSVVIFPLAFCVFVNRERLKSKYEPSQNEIEANFYELKSKISPDIYSEITRIADEGDAFAEVADYRQALEKYNSALQIVPQPLEEHDAATWIQMNIGDCYFSAQMYEEAAEAFYRALFYPKAFENAFILLRLGQSFFELGEMKKAAKLLANAYLLEGVGIFEEEDPKYFEFLKMLISPPQPL